MRKVDWSKYVDECYCISRYKLAYENSISTSSDKNSWEKSELRFKVRPPRTRRPRGRPKKKRIRALDEGKGKLAKRMHRCPRCKGYGHHANACKESINQEDASGGSSRSNPPRRRGRGRGTRKGRNNAPNNSRVGRIGLMS
ncbi:hypothetical protein AKJ16_DCAP11101 [Drosera capensis]